MTRKTTIAMILLTAMVTALAACESEPAEAEAVADEAAEEAPEESDEGSQLASFPGNDWECSNESAGKIEQWLTARQEMRADLVTFDTQGRVELAEVDGEPAQDSYRPVLTLEENRLFVDDRLAARDFQGDYDRYLTEPITRALEQARAEAELLDEDPPTFIPLLAIDHRVSFRALGHVFEALADIDLDRVALLFEKPAPEPTAEAIPEELKYRLTDMLTRDYVDAAEVEGAREEATADCPQIAEVFIEAQSASVEDRPAILRQGVAQAWLDCDCQADIEFVSAYLAWTPPQQIPATVMEMDIEELLEKVEPGDTTRWSTLW